jgi:hypothetical protein
MDEGTLKKALQESSDGPFYKTDFSIGHRGAALRCSFPSIRRNPTNLPRAWVLASSNVM